MIKVNTRFLQRWLPTIFFLFFVATHFVMVYGYHMVPWRMGGFAMYASNDSIIKFRRIFAEGITEDGKHCYLELKKLNRDYGRKPRLTYYKYFPQKSHLEKLANQFMASKYIKLTLKTKKKKHVDRLLYRPITDKARKKDREKAISLKAVRVWMARRVYNPRTGVLSWRPLYEAVEAGTWS